MTDQSSDPKSNWPRVAFAALAALALLGAAPATGWAQGSAQRPTAVPPPPPPPPPSQARTAVRQGERFGAWTIVCEAVGPGRTRCVLLQTIGRQEAGQQQVLLQAQVEGLETGETPRLTLRLPLGVDLATPVQLQVDGGGSWNVPYVRCQTTGCVAGATLSDTELRALVGGQTLRVTYQVEGEARPLDIGLVGLQAGRNSIQP
jgi:invasion protein IalB